MSATLDAILYRFTNRTDTIAGLGSTEKIEFNLATVPDNTGRMTSPRLHMARDFNIHPNPRRALDQIQDALLGINDIRLTGYFTDHSSTLGPRNLRNWMVGTSENTDFPSGRFGLVLNSFAGGILNLQPVPRPSNPNDEDTVSAGYHLTEIDVEDVENPRDEMQFIVTLYRDGVISEI